MHIIAVKNGYGFGFFAHNPYNTSMRPTITKKDIPVIELSEEGYKQFQADHARLTEERKDVLVRLQAAREMGDLSENGAYTAAKFELGSIDRQLRRLNYQLRFGKITKTKHDGTVDFGSKVTIDQNGKEMTFELVSGYESDPKAQKLSVYSPIGKAIQGHRAGDTVEAVVPAGTIKITIKHIA
jgi:transcription elongation factor GreA